MFNMMVRVLIFCTCFALIKAEESNTIYMEINTKHDCSVAPSYELIAGPQCFVKLTTPYVLSSGRLDVNNGRHYFTVSDRIEFHGNMSRNFTILNLHRVYTFIINLEHDLNGDWKFFFTCFDGLDMTYKICSKSNKTDNKYSCFCKTNVTIKEQEMLHSSAAVSVTPHDDTNLLPIVVGLFGIWNNSDMSNTIYCLY
ncbi:unnamed protein product [Spodoptera littoralis]|uniref:Uncharacterized protein n=1 Tax=Spodoptera littoralis TaxID=7109 RepID=A0A9P0N5I6_SPOLI|nr:unnamed protein product [Spodoptera littoralis]CAH1642274.1 unnamed protein product [Spodoptera littoralis]